MTKRSEPVHIAKQSMEDADKMHDLMAKLYGENSDEAVYAVQASIANFMLFCALERRDWD